MFSIVIVIPFLVFAAALWLGLRRNQANRVTDPSCGQCRYIVRGLEGNICPECGSDLRVVGILQPGTIKPLSRPKRLLLWLFLAPAPAFILWAILTPLVAPMWLLTTERRVIFVQAPYCNAIITANAEGKKLVFGYPRFTAATLTQPAAPPEVLFLSLTSGGAASPQSLDIDLPARTYRYFSKAGLKQGKFDAKAIEMFLNDHGFNDPRIADRAADILTAVDEMGAPAGIGFTKFPNDSTLRPVRSPGIAHPTSTFNRPQSNELTAMFPFVLFILVYVAGFWFAWREQRHGTVRSTVHSVEKPSNPAGPSMPREVVQQ